MRLLQYLRNVTAKPANLFLQTGKHLMKLQITFQSRNNYRQEFMKIFCGIKGIPVPDEKKQGDNENQPKASDEKGSKSGIAG